MAAGLIRNSISQKGIVIEGYLVQGNSRKRRVLQVFPSQPTTRESPPGTPATPERPRTQERSSRCRYRRISSPTEEAGMPRLDSDGPGRSSSINVQGSACVVRKYRRLRRRRSLRHEYQKLRSLLPLRHIARPIRHKIGVVDAAYRYICDLHTALLHKFSARGVPGELRGVVGHPVRTAADVQTLALHLIQTGQVQQRPPPAPASAAPAGGTPAAAVHLTPGT